MQEIDINSAMKSIMLNSRVLMTSMLILTLAACLGAQELPTYDVPRLASITIDGDMTDWGQDGFRVDLLTPIDAPLKPIADHDSRIRLGWNDTGLLLLVLIQDDLWRENPTKSELWKWDGIETFLAPNRGSSTMCQWVITPGMDPAQPELRWHLHDYRKDPEAKKWPADIQAARTKTDTGCLVEVLLPWQAVGVKPEVGTQVAFQIFVNDADQGADATQYHAVWWPDVKTSGDSTRTHRLRLAKAPSAPIAARVSGEYDFQRIKTIITATAQADQLGKKAVVLEDSKSLGDAILHDDGHGRATATIELPIPPAQEAHGPLTVGVDGRPTDTMKLDNPSRVRGEAFLHTVPTARPCVFSGTRLPEVRFERPRRLEHIIGPYDTKVTYYDSEYNVVHTAPKPGRYGAVVAITTKDGHLHRRFVTLFRHEQEIRWWRHEVQASLELPRELGIAPEAAELYKKDVGDYLKWQMVNRFEESSEGAVMFAGLHEVDPAEAEAGFYNNPWQRDRQWWVGLKRRLYGWNTKFPERYDCPYLAEEQLGAVVREGSAAEAGMKPDTAAQIDAMLQAWANDTAEAFAVCVVRHGVIVLHKAYGVRDGKPMTVDTKSWMASLTKLISGTLLMSFVDRGLISLDDEVGDYLPPLRDIKTNKPLLVKHLYTHTSGLSWHWGAEDNDMEERIAALLPHLEVGVKYSYNGTGMNLGSKIMEAISGESLPSLYRNHLLGPLGCNGTDIADGGGGARSIPLDMAKIGQMLLNKGAYGRMRFMSPETFEKMLPGRLTDILGPQTQSVYGIGTMAYSDKGLGEGTFAHGAASGATMRIDPVNDLVIVTCRNSAGLNFGRYHQRFIDAIVQGMTTASGGTQ